MNASAPMHDHNRGSYYVPDPSPWPPLTALGLALMLGGFAMVLHGGTWVLAAVGALVLIFAVVRWFGTVIGETETGAYDAKADRSFRLGMAWFIFTEVLFFAGFFGALFYIRMFAVPWLGGEGHKGEAHLLWPGFVAQWPLLETPSPKDFAGAHAAMGPTGIPALNTAVLLTSGLTVTVAHWALKHDNRRRLKRFLIATVSLGALFLVLQAYEFYHAYTELGLTLSAGVYGSTFYMLTGFHGLHVTLGLIMLSAVLGRVMRGHFTPTSHFGFEATALYWHFVDAVWLGLYLFVYWL